ncbi:MULTISPECIES: hypothetical protein [unclassified Moorena]|nr:MULTISPECIES: hypothetical protein [unclassified Moorena]NEO17977.1 hypothetical protein [Moorena sp. SIO4A5]NEQ56256.1 hypothetical protein [Moorena sp. SIO4A1]
MRSHYLVRVLDAIALSCTGIGCDRIILYGYWMRCVSIEPLRERILF